MKKLWIEQSFFVCLFVNFDFVLFIYFPPVAIKRKVHVRDRQCKIFLGPPASLWNMKIYHQTTMIQWNGPIISGKVCKYSIIEVSVWVKSNKIGHKLGVSLAFLAKRCEHFATIGKQKKQKKQKNVMWKTVNTLKQTKQSVCVWQRKRGRETVQLNQSVIIRCYVLFFFSYPKRKTFRITANCRRK